jgi:predicted Na+-dependent transporter
MTAVTGLLFLGTGATVVSQTILSISRSPLDASVIVTLIFVILPISLGLLAIRLAVRTPVRWTLRSRLYLVLLGCAGLAIWAGFLIGPALVIAAAVIPSKAAPAAMPEVEA